MQGSSHDEIMTWTEVGSLIDWATQVPLLGNDFKFNRKLARIVPRNFISFALLFSLALRLFLCIYTHASFFPESCVICRHHIPLSVRVFVRISQEQKHSYITIVNLSKSGNLTLIQYYYVIHSPYSNIANCPSIVVFMGWGGFCFTGLGSNPETHIVVNCHVS